MTDHAAEPNTDPVALIFPGQGSQAPGMGKLVYQKSEAARRTFEEASDLTHLDVAKICFDSDVDDLAETTYTQPAVLTTSVAIVAAIALTMRRRPGLKAQDVAKQVAVRREDRVRVIKMPAERRDAEGAGGEGGR